MPGRQVVTRSGSSRPFAGVASPATTGKPCGRSPGRPRHANSGPAPRYPAVKKQMQSPKLQHMAAISVFS